MSWAEIKKAVNDNLTVPLNRQYQIPRMVVYVDNATFVAPRSTWYLITAVGAGGTGGAGDTEPGVPEANGGGGGGGAISASKLYFEKGMSVPITIDSNGTTFGSFMSAGAGGTGGTGVAGKPSQHGVGGTGGVAVGGNLFNINGNDGSGINGGSAGLTTVAGYGINGAGSGYLPIPNPSNISTCGTTDTSPTLGGGKAGHKSAADTNGTVGTGGAGFGGGGSGGRGGSSSTAGGWGILYGGEGGSGAVFIEYFEELTATDDTTALNHTFLKENNSLTIAPNGSETINVTFSGNILSVVANVVNTEINCEYSYEVTTLTIVLTNTTAESINANYSYSAIIEGVGATII